MSDDYPYICRPWAEWEDNALQRYLDAGLSFAGVAVRLNRTRCAVAGPKKAITLPRVSCLETAE